MAAPIVFIPGHDRTSPLAVHGPYEPSGPQSRAHCALLDNFYHKNTDISYLIDLQEHRVSVLKRFGECERSGIGE